MILSSQTLRRIPIPLRAHAAAAAGFTATGAHHEDLDVMHSAGTRVDGLRRGVEAAGGRVVEVGFVHRWAGEETEAHAEREALIELAAALGASRLNAGLFTAPAGADLVDRFRALCRHAARHGLRVSLEFFPFGAVPDAKAAWDIVNRAGEANADVLFDAWHWYRGGGDMSFLSTLPRGAIGCLQLSDAAAVSAADVGEESRHGRLLPGAGSIDLVGLLDALQASGHHPPVAVEVLSDELGLLDPHEAATRAYDAARRILDASGWAG